jgi:hypothetical protein
VLTPGVGIVAADHVVRGGRRNLPQEAAPLE